MPAPIPFVAGDRGHHFNYEIQAWVLRGRVKACAHPTEMRVGRPCCNAFRFQGMTESAAVAAVRAKHVAPCNIYKCNIACAQAQQSTSSPRPRLDFVNHRGE